MACKLTRRDSKGIDHEVLLKPGPLAGSSFGCLISRPLFIYFPAGKLWIAAAPFKVLICTPELVQVSTWHRQSLVVGSPARQCAVAGFTAFSFANKAVNWSDSLQKLVFDKYGVGQLRSCKCARPSGGFLTNRGLRSPGWWSQL